MLVGRTEEIKGVAGNSTQPRSIALAKGGISSGKDFYQLTANLLTEVITGEISTEKANAACRAGSNLLKYVELCGKGYEWPSV